MFKKNTKEKLKDDKRFVSKVNKFKKDCVFCKKKDLDIDYKNVELLARYVSSRGKILSRRISGNCAKHQRKIAKEIKLARFLNLIPYVGRITL